jgi:dihydrofolate reductase
MRNDKVAMIEGGRIVVSDNVSLDGVIQDPAGDEGFRRGGWVGLIKDRPGLSKLALDEALGAKALLLGRRTYEWLAARWPSRSGELADSLNSLPKYVVSSSLEDPESPVYTSDRPPKLMRKPTLGRGWGSDAVTTWNGPMVSSPPGSK